MKNGLLIILDGYGEGKPDAYNAVNNAKTPTLNQLKAMPHSLLETSGEAVGIFKGELGGSEVGHLTIGAGRIEPSTAKKIHDDVLNGNFKKNAKLLKILKTLSTNKANLHLIGMMSDKNVHSNIYHAFEVIDMAKDKAQNIFLHLITDGRDTEPYESLKYLKLVKQKIKNIKNCHIASISGRGYAMDRESNLDRTKKAYDAMFINQGEIAETEIENYLKEQHKTNNDQFVLPVHIKTNAKFLVGAKDVLLFFNFREDRLRQIVKMSEQLGATMVTMASVGTSKTVQLYPASVVKHTLSEHLSSLNLSQIKISESTKYAHVTYFFNGGVEEPFDREDRVHVPSYKVENFAQTPKMRAKEIANETITAINRNYNAIIVNFSNPDMLGHTGDYDATVKGLEYLDKCLKKVLNAAIKKDYVVLITADHGNAEQMRTASGQPHMAHTLNKVFCVAVGNKKYNMKKLGGLKDVAPTLLDLMELNKYKYFEGNSLILK